MHAERPFPNSHLWAWHCASTAALPLAAAAAAACATVASASLCCCTCSSAARASCTAAWACMASRCAASWLADSSRCSTCSWCCSRARWCCSATFHAAAARSRASSSWRRASHRSSASEALAWAAAASRSSLHAATAAWRHGWLHCGDDAPARAGWGYRAYQGAHNLAAPQRRAKALFVQHLTDLAATPHLEPPGSADEPASSPSGPVTAATAARVPFVGSSGLGRAAVPDAAWAACCACA